MTSNPYLIIFFFLLLHCINAKSQNVLLQTSASLPSSVSESSGIEIVNHTSIWTHNDSGGQPELYEIDSLGNLLRTLTIANSSNVDWEDITSDDQGNIYIGDFGNNYNTRTDLRIYVINNPDSIANDSTYAQKIKFTLSDQIAFPPSNADLNYDIEAMVWFNDSIYLFSKNRSIPYSGYTKYYSLPAITGTYVAELVDSFYGGSGSAWDYQICAADISPDKKQLFLLSHDKAWIFSCFTGSDFFSGSMQQLNFSNNTQKEGICYLSDSIIYITDEYSYGSGGNIYIADISNWANKPVVFLGGDTMLSTTDTITLYAGNNNCNYLWSTGDTVQEITIDTAGIYSLIVTAQNGCTGYDSIQVFSQIISGIQTQFYHSDEITIYPNPAQHQITIQGLNCFTEKHISIQLYNQMGSLIYDGFIEKVLDRNECSYLFPSIIKSGVYTMRLSTFSQHSDLRIVVLPN